MKRLNEELLLEIRRRGWHQYQLAARAGITENTVSRIVRGHIDPTLQVKIKIAEALQTPVERLFPQE